MRYQARCTPVLVFIYLFARIVPGAAYGEDCSASSECTADAKEFCVSGKCGCGSLYTVNNDDNGCVETSCADPNAATCNSLGNAVCTNTNICDCASTHNEDTETGACVSNGLTDACAADGDCVAVTDAVCETGSLQCACPATHITGENTCTPKVIGDPCGAVEDCDFTNSACTDSKCDCAAEYTAIDGDCVKGLTDACAADGDCVAVTDAVCESLVCTCPATHVTGENTCTPKGLGDTCGETGDCTAVTGAVCESQECACPSTHLKGENTCTPKALGDPCGSNGDCTSNVANSACTSSTCQCATGYTADSGSCVLVLGKSCTTTTECSGVTNAFCLSEECTCGPLYTASSTTCVAKACSGTCEDIDNSSCNDDDECICASGYTMDATTGACVTAGNGCAAILVSVSLMLVSVLSAIFVN